MLKYLSKFVAVFGITAMLLPAVALAHGTDNNFGRLNSTVNEFGVKVFDTTQVNKNLKPVPKPVEDKNKDKDHDADKDAGRDHGVRHFINWRNGFIPNLFYNGTVTAVSGSTISIQTNDSTNFTINAGSAKIVKIPNTVIAVADIQVGDAVHITGNKTSAGSTTIDASVIYVLPANLKPAIAKGTVTAVNTNSITVQTKDDGTSITVNTTPDTTIVDANNNTVAQADIATDAKVKVIGFWDTVLNVFNAIKIKLF
jgi:hypothetical protein